MPSLKKIISALCAAAMAATSGALVPVMAAAGDIYNDFDSYDPGVYADVTSGTVSETLIDGVTLYTGSRTGASNSNVQIEAGVGIDGSNALTIHNGKFSNIDRGSRVGLNTPTGLTNFKATMKVKRDANQKLYYSDGTTTNGVHPTTQIPLPDEEWHDLGIYVRGEDRIITVDYKIVVSDKTKTLPILWGAEVDDSNANYVLTIDNLEIGELTEADSSELTINTIDLKTYTQYVNGEATTVTNEIIVPTEDPSVYGVSAGTFGVDVSVGGVGIAWSSNNDLVEVTDRGVITVHPASEDTAVTLTASVAKYPDVKRDFTLKIQGTGAFLEYVASLIDLTQDNVNVSRNEAPSEGSEAEESYTAIAGFTAPTSLNGAQISWSSDDPNVSINGGSIDLKSWDESTFNITATIGSGGESVTKLIEITVPAARVFYDESFDDWATGNLVDLATPSNEAHPGFSFSSATRNGTGEHYITIASGGADGGNFMNDVLTQYNDDGSRTHSMTFTKMSGVAISKDLYAEFNFRINNATSIMRITDGSSNIDLSVDDNIKENVWYHMVLTVISGGSYTAVITNAATGAAVTTMTGTGGPSRILRFDGTANYYSFAFDNLYIASGNVPAVAGSGVNSITAGETAQIATASRINSDEDVTVEFEPAIEGVEAVVENGVVSLKTAATSKGSTNVTVKAKTDIEVSTVIPVTIGDNAEFAESAKDALVGQIVNGTTVTGDEAGDTVTVSSGSLTLPTTLYGAGITWTSSNPNIVMTNGAVLPTLDGPDEVTITADVVYGEGEAAGKASKDIKVNLKPYKDAIKAEMEAAKTSTETIPYTDSVTKGAVNFNIGDSSKVILNNITFPTSASATDTITVDYKVDENPYLSQEGVISVSDTNAHPVKITRTINYVKNGAVLASDVKEYNPSVQFKTEDVENFLVGKDTGALWTQNEEWEIRDQYLKAMVHNYVVKFDSQLASNFDGVPTDSVSGNFTVKTKGEFGSTISWTSSLGTIITARNDGTMQVSRPNSTANVTLTATLNYESADSVSKTFRVSVPGTGSGSSGGGGGGYYGGGSSSGGGTSRGGGGNTSYTTNSEIPSQQSSPANPNPSGFNDLDSVPWAVTAINNLYVNGIINGKVPGMFCPNDSVTRAEFAKILIGAFGIPTVAVGSATFTDVPVGHWASSYIETAYQKGIITGYDNGAFDPDAYVTRQDMAVMVQRAATTMGYTLSAKVEAVAFTDAADIASYAQEAVSTLQQANIVSGVGNGAFEPLSTSTRAQACQMIYNVFNK